MSGISQSVFVPSTSPYMLPSEDFDALIGEIGQNIAWMKSHACPCVWTNSGSTIGRLATAGSPQKSCLTCNGVGIYWDTPTLPFRAVMTFRHISPSPDEPGVAMDDKFGVSQMSEPALTVPYWNPFLDPGDPRQPTPVWCSGTTNDIFVAVDMLARYSTALKVGEQENLPFQQNLQIDPVGAVTIWDTTAKQVTSVTGYTVSGATVTLPDGYAEGTSYIVEFQAAALYVAFRRAGGLPHDRPFGGGMVNLPKAFRVQALDFWTRQRGIQPAISVGGYILASQIT